MKTFFLSIIVSVFFLYGCNKYDNTVAAAKLQVPDFTETGANTFGVYVSGKPWANFGETYVPEELGTGNNVVNKVSTSLGRDYVNSADSLFNISAMLTVQKKGKAKREESMRFSIPLHGDLKGVHLLNDRDGLFNYENFLSSNNSFGSLKRAPVTVVVLKDSIVIATNQRIVSGKFYGMLYQIPDLANPKPDSLQITGGVFDVIFNYHRY